ncbi:hypothetical protein PAXRUDRAFT_827633 [Paxillus rubicundulus Ve08.2h10]|uniref:Uncharacterized protein n=1 Tax=Paxillus rubicundulus Ve08.2h10 TaxID=930991 RepID=A0A0D0DXK6_9AGAM|nr:hypothetical protein PAXRUDRAFT_827633 [Paxillus rubicundulus Ve08.2h10]
MDLDCMDQSSSMQVAWRGSEYRSTGRPCNHGQQVSSEKRPCEGHMECSNTTLGKCIQALGWS